MKLNSTSVWLALGLVCATPIALAQVAAADEHGAHHLSAAVPAEAAAPDGHEHGADSPDPMQQSMQHIEGLMQQIEETADPDRKRALLGEHLQAMRDQIKGLRGQGHAMKAAMKGGDKKDGEMMGGMMKSGGMMKMHQKMEQRIGMLERLLQQTLEREAVEESLGRH